MVEKWKDALAWMPTPWRIAANLSLGAVVCGLLIWSITASHADSKAIFDELRKDARDDRVTHRQERAEDRAALRELAKEIAAAVVELRKGIDTNREMLLEVRRAVGKPEPREIDESVSRGNDAAEQAQGVRPCSR